MSIKVAKFGGTSLANASQIRKVRDIVAADPARRYVVPSAPGKRDKADHKITDLLYLCHEHARQGLPIDSVFDIIEARYREIVRDLGIGLDLDPHLAAVRDGILRQGRGGTADFAASRGEYLSGLILAELLGYRFVDAAELIFFDARGRLDEDRTYATIRDTLGRLANAVIPGFYGSAHDGGVRTFSRGGSDVTGAIVARGARASLYENWTDVSGLLMADPRIVDQPRCIQTITYRELRELAYMGATVLHDEAIFPVRKAGIPVNIRNTNRADEPGTMIVADTANVPANPRAITGIAGKRDFTVIALEKALMNAEIGFGRKVLSVLERHGVSFEHLPSGIDTMSIVIEDAKLNGKLDDVLTALRNEVQPDAIEVMPDMSLIATVGRGMAHTPGMAARLFAALADAGVNIRMIDQGSSELNIIVGVAEADFEVAMRAIYAAFVR
jgi:aspartate kinase